MDAIEANALITFGARQIPELGRKDPQEQAHVAKLWAAIMPHVPIADGEAAMLRLIGRYHAGDNPPTPADIRDEAGYLELDGPTAPELVPFDREFEIAETRRVLGILGITEREYDDDAAVRQRVVAFREQAALEGPVSR